MSDDSFRPDWFSKPGDTLAAIMSSRELTANVLAEKLSCDVSTVRGLLAGSLLISEDLAFRLADVVGGTTCFWHKRQSAYEEALARAAVAVPRDKGQAWLKKIPFKDIALYGWTDKPTRGLDGVKSCLAYFGVTGPDEWEERYTNFAGDVAFRTSPSSESKIGPLSAWLRQGEIQAALVQCAPWNPDLLRSAILDLRRLTKAKSLTYVVPRLRNVCAAAGVAVVCVRTPAGCRASGAARFVAAEKAIVILSFRHLSDDHVWFTLFHEMGHLILHGRSSTFVDADETSPSERETEANAFAASAIIPLDRYEEFMSLRPRTENVVRFAVSIGVSPGLIVGQMQHLGMIGRNQLNFLKRRFVWDEISAAFD